MPTKRPHSKKTSGHADAILYAYFALLLATAIWGVATVVIKVTLDYMPIYHFMFFRFLIVGISLLPFMIWELRKNPIDLKDFPTLLLLGLTGQTGIVLIVAGIYYTTAIDAAIIGAVAPLMVVAAGHYFYKDKIDRKLEIGIILATIGTLIVVLEPALSNSTANDTDTLKRIFGNLLVVGYNVAFATYILLSKKVMGAKSANMSKTLTKLKIKPLKNYYSPFMHTSISFYIALASFIPLVFLESLGIIGTEINGFSFATLPWEALVGVLYMAIFSSIVAYVAFQWGLERARVSDSALFSYLGPLFTIPAAYLMIGEVPTTFAIVGATVIAVGVIIAEKRK